MDIAAENALGGIAVTAKGNSGGGGQEGPAGARDGGADDAEEADDLSRVGSEDMDASLYGAGQASEHAPSSPAPPRDDRAEARPPRLERAPGNTDAPRRQTARRGRGPNGDPVAWTEVRWAIRDGGLELGGGGAYS